MRFLMALAVSMGTVIAAWPWIRQFAPLLRQGDRQGDGGKPKPATRGEMIYFAVLTVVVLTFVTSTLLWLFGGR